VQGIGSQRLRTLVATFGSAQAALDAPQSKPARSSASVARGDGNQEASG